jgi:tetratricopeptide (TPR) repeat protein
MRPTSLATLLRQALLLLACLGPSLPAIAGDVKPPPLSPAADCDEALAHLPVSYNSQKLEAALAPHRAALTADQLNAYGMRCHKKGRFKESNHFFGLAISVDPKHALAHYNLACALARLREQGAVPCNDPSTMAEDIALHLRTSVTLDKQRAIRARTDRDLDWARTMLRFRLNYLDAPKSPTELAALFDGVTLWGPTPGIYTMAEASFKRAQASGLTGTVKGWTLDVEGGTMDEIPRQGTWRAEPGKIIVDWSGKPGSTETITLDALGSHTAGSWNTLPDECGA